MSTPEDDKRPSEQLPTFAEGEEHAHAHEGEQQQQQYYEDDQHYDENGQPYSEDEQQYDENGQPYSEHEQQYDENGQPYSDEHYGEHESDQYAHEHATHQIDAYPTIPMATFTGPPAPMPPSSRSRLGAPFSRQPLPPSSGHLHTQQGGPYRIPVAPEPPTTPAFRPALAPTPRPFLGSALAIYGVLLWSFVVAGQFATSWITGSPMSNGMAVFIVFAATTAAWIFAIRRSRVAVPTMTLAQGVGRGVLTAAAAGLMFLLTLIFATILGQTSNRNHDFGIAFFLVLTAIAATVFGPRLTLPVRPQRTHGARFAIVSLWMMGAIVTFIAGAELATNG